MVRLFIPERSLKFELTRAGPETEANFRIDWHLVALPIVQRQAPDDPLYLFKRWLANSLILRPIPSLDLEEIRNRRRSNPMSM